VAEPTPYYSLGEFVVCLYDYLDFFSFIYDDDDDGYAPHYGIIVDIDLGYLDYLEEPLYSVLCMDGEKRYFMESEIKLAYYR
jgi:hypothetical protein